MKLNLSMSATHARIEVKHDNEKTPPVALNSKGAVAINAVQAVIVQEIQNFILSEQKKEEAQENPKKKQPKKKVQRGERHVKREKA